LLEEERRLFYVGMTRAMRKLSLYGVYRRRNYQGWSSNEPSRFLFEVPQELLAFNEAAQELLESNQTQSQSNGESHYEVEPITQVEVGDHVYHPTYGNGNVEEISKEKRDIKVLVNFKDFGKRRVSLRHLG
jgi:DNA helicase-2/ATP-dependent DNA helicase PcrA